MTPVFRSIARSTGFVAVPSGRGVHREPTPLLGGAALYVGCLAGILAGALASGTLQLGSTRILGFLAGATIVFVMGILDDRYNLGWFSKLLVQLVAAVILLAGHNVGPLPLMTPVGLLLSLLWIVGLANAMNFLDNMDGMAAGIAFVIALSLAGLALVGGSVDVAFLAAALAGAALGFLRYNFHPASIFLGDAGSLLLGYLLASAGLAVARPQAELVELLIPVIALGYPIFDITFVSVTRALRGQHLTQGGKDHTSHRLARITGDTRKTALIVYALCAGLGVAACALQVLNFDPATFVASVAIFWFFIWFGLKLCREAPVPEETQVTSTMRVAP